MTVVYILKSLITEKYYIGCTDNFDRRVMEHNNGFVRSTKSLRPLKVMLVQEFDSLSEARRIELKLKKLKRKDYIEKIIKEKVIKLTV